MTQDERDALTKERIELQRKYTRSLGTPGYGARAAKIAQMIEAIDAKLDAPKPQEPAEPISTVSLAGKTLADPDATPEAKSLAASVLARAGD